MDVTGVEWLFVWLIWFDFLLLDGGNDTCLHWVWFCYWLFVTFRAFCCQDIWASGEPSFSCFYRSVDSIVYADIHWGICMGWWNDDLPGLEFWSVQAVKYIASYQLSVSKCELVNIIRHYSSSCNYVEPRISDVQPEAFAANRRRDVISCARPPKVSFVYGMTLLSYITWYFLLLHCVDLIDC